MGGETKTTTDHDTIRDWVELRGGLPARVKGTGDGDDSGILRVDFPGRRDDEALETIDRETFFDKFEESRFAKLVSREGEDG